MYGIDSMGNICGSAVNNWNGTQGPDLTSRSQLYYLDPSQVCSAWLLAFATHAARIFPIVLLNLIQIIANLQLWDTFNLPWAKTVCLETCPQQESYCDLNEHAGNPCTNNSQYQCPYYFGAEDDLYGYLPDVADPFDTQYYDALGNTTKTECEVDSGLGDLGSFLNVAQDIVASVDPGSAASTCGLYYQVYRTHVAINSLGCR